MMPTVDASASQAPNAFDGVVAAAAFILALAYVVAMPRNLALGDESYFLAESKRIHEGGVLYRDIFWLAGPISHWIMARVFGLFGTSITVARTTLGVLLGSLTVLLYLSCRRLGVRPSLALVPAALYLAFCYPVFPYITPHTFSTVAMAAILYTLLWRDPLTRPLTALAPGLCTGVLALSHQHQGAAFALAVTLLFLVEGVIAYRGGQTSAAGSVWRAIGWYGLGIAVVAIPGLVALLLATPARVLVDQTILMPLTGYRVYNTAGWGATWPPGARYTWPLLRYSPLALVPAILWLARGWWRRRPITELAAAATLLAVGGASIASIFNLPDSVHIGFIAGLLFVAGAAAIDGRWGGLTRFVPALRGLALPLALGILALAAIQMTRNYQRMWAQFRYPLETAFGRVDFEQDGERYLVQRVNAVVGDGSRVVFAYPTWAALYLTTDTDNPTRHNLILPGLLSAGEIDGTIEALAANRPATVVVVGPKLIGADTDRILDWITAHYDVSVAEPLSKPRFTIYRLRSAAPSNAS